MARRKAREAFHEREAELREKEDALELQVAVDQYSANVCLEQAIIEEQEQREIVRVAILELDKRVRKRELYEVQLRSANKQRDVLRRQIGVRRRVTKENELQRIQNEEEGVIEKFAATESGDRYSWTVKMATRKVRKMCTLTDAATELNITAPEYVEQLFQKSATRAQAGGKDLPQRESFNAEKEHKGERARIALERGEDDTDEDVDDVWADAASKAEVIRLEGELDTLRRRITRVEVVVRELAVKSNDQQRAVSAGGAQLHNQRISWHDT